MYPPKITADDKIQKKKKNRKEKIDKRKPNYKIKVHFQSKNETCKAWKPSSQIVECGESWELLEPIRFNKHF